MKIINTMTIINLEERQVQRNYPNPNSEEKPFLVYYISINFQDMRCYFRNIIDDTKINVVFGVDFANQYINEEEVQDAVQKLEEISNKYNCPIRFLIESYWEHSGRMK